jgi:hypothetical protein
MDLETLKKDHPELHAQVLEAGRAEGRKEAAPAPASEPNTDLEKEVVRLRAQVESMAAENTREKRENIAIGALEAAKLPEAGKAGDVDLDASFRAHLISLATSAESDEQARDRVRAAIEERRAILGIKEAPKSLLRDARGPSLPKGSTEGKQERSGDPAVTHMLQNLGI